MPRPYLALAALALATACQSYKFEAINPQPVVVVNQQVNISAKLKPPSIMIVQDTSGSMCESIGLTDNTGVSCIGKDGYCSNCSPGNGSCANGCTTKMQLTTNSINQILGQLNPASGQLFIGLTAFPDDLTGNEDPSVACATGKVIVPVGDATTTTPQIQQYYTSIAGNPSGGTPTGATLLGPVADDPSMKNPDPTAPKYVLLITDGLPNCNSNNPCGTMAWSNGSVYGCESPTFLASQGTNASPPAGCTCSFGDCSGKAGSGTCCSGSSPAFCLDATAAIAAVTSLKNQGVTTIVVGMGSDYTQGAASVLDGMMVAGGSGLNGGTHYQADNPATLLSVLQNLIQQLTASCVYTLDQPPVDPGLVTVTLNGTQLQANDPNGYTFTPPQTVTINGTSCASITGGGNSESLEITAIAR